MMMPALVSAPPSRLSQAQEAFLGRLAHHIDPASQLMPEIRRSLNDTYRLMADLESLIPRLPWDPHQAKIPARPLNHRLLEMTLGAWRSSESQIVHREEFCSDGDLLLGLEQFFSLTSDPVSTVSTVTLGIEMTLSRESPDFKDDAFAFRVSRHLSGISWFLTEKLVIGVKEKKHRSGSAEATPASYGAEAEIHFGPSRTPIASPFAWKDLKFREWWISRSPNDLDQGVLDDETEQYSQGTMNDLGRSWKRAVDLLGHTHEEIWPVLREDRVSGFREV